jgi:hypothetical protein
MEGLEIRGKGIGGNFCPIVDMKDRYDLPGFLSFDLYGLGNVEIVLVRWGNEAQRGPRTVQGSSRACRPEGSCAQNNQAQLSGGQITGFLCARRSGDFREPWSAPRRADIGPGSPN